MSNPHASVLAQFLNSRNVPVTRERLLNDPMPFSVTLADVSVFFSFRANGSLAIFSLITDFETLDLKTIVILNKEALKINNFKWGDQVRFFIDEAGRHLFASVILPPQLIDPIKLKDAFEELISVSQNFRKVHNINYTPFSE